MYNNLAAKNGKKAQKPPAFIPIMYIVLPKG